MINGTEEVLKSMGMLYMKDDYPELLKKLEANCRKEIAEEVSLNVKMALENCACLDAQTALNPGPGEMKTTYVERMHTMIINGIKK